jgi:hypothetical protein
VPLLLGNYRFKWYLICRERAKLSPPAGIVEDDDASAPSPLTSLKYNFLQHQPFQFINHFIDGPSKYPVDSSPPAIRVGRLRETGPSDAGRPIIATLYRRPALLSPSELSELNPKQSGDWPERRRTANNHNRNASLVRRLRWGEKHAPILQTACEWPVYHSSGAHKNPKFT